MVNGSILTSGTVIFSLVVEYVSLELLENKITIYLLNYSDSHIPSLRHIEIFPPKNSTSFKKTLIMYKKVEGDFSFHFLHIR